jgi:hypothetical protein
MRLDFEFALEKPQGGVFRTVEFDGRGVVIKDEGFSG